MYTNVNWEWYNMNIKRWVQSKQQIRIRFLRGGVNMTVLAKPMNFAIVLDKSNHSVLQSKKDSNYMEKLDIMKKRAERFSKNVK